ncbi:Aspartate/ornithine carbamoyltransferase [Boletus edulis]|nr:Aspartate/ornithine carbamoyltransferase [Boletus edulis]
MSPVPHLMSMADLTGSQILRMVSHAHTLKQVSLPWLAPQSRNKKNSRLRMPSQSLFNKSITLIFSKRSTRTRVSAETATVLLGGRALFLGHDDIQLGVNESPRDTARVLGGMCQGIFARVGDHAEIEELAKYSPVPVLNALSSLWHPTQILADVLTLHEHAHLFEPTQVTSPGPNKSLPSLRPLTVAYVGDSANLRVASPPQPTYQCPKAVWDRVTELGCNKDIWWGSDPREAVNGADVVVTDTWISMGQEAEKEQRLKDFAGYQVTEALCREGGANPNWKFLHCLPRKQDEVDDEVFYGPRSLVFPEADNRKWTIMAAFDLLFGKWDLTGEHSADKATR